MNSVMDDNYEEYSKSIEILLNSPLFELNEKEKDERFMETMNILHRHHVNKSEHYANIFNSLFNDKGQLSFNKFNEMPYIPARLFKSFELKSVDTSSIRTVMHSSGTSGQIPSRIFLDANTSVRQRKVLSRITSSFLGISRFPILFFEPKSIISNHSSFSARKAAVLGFLPFATDVCFALTESGKIDENALVEFIERNCDGPILLFGFTSVVWEVMLSVSHTLRLPILRNATLLHGGGWKKLASLNISKRQFHEAINSVFENLKIRNYYGMIEQTGSIYVECDYEFLHASEFSEIITRRKSDLKACSYGELGIIQVGSLLPWSYPGHSILTEDIGVIFGRDNCECGRGGAYFSIQGRLESAEVRGCSDVSRA